MKPSSWSVQPVGRINNGNGVCNSDWLDELLAERALREGLSLISYRAQGRLGPDCTLQHIKDLLSSVGAQPWSQDLNGSLGGTWMTNDSRFDITGDNSRIWLNALSVNRDELKLFEELLKKLEVPKAPEKRGSVNVLVAGQHGLMLQQLGYAGENFEPGNYAPEIADGYSHAVKDLNRKNPCGRIVILDGPPGTGKTHMVRALLNEVPEATFILVQASVITELGNPEFIPVLMNARHTGTLILILEDADECLSSRKAENVAAISALLNFTDGIFGALLDIRIVATTNVRMTDIDAAVTRPGRLCQHLHIGRHDRMSALSIYTRLMGIPSVAMAAAKLQAHEKEGTGVEFKADKTYSLADIYIMALKHGAVIHEEPSQDSADDEGSDDDEDSDTSF